MNFGGTSGRRTLRFESSFAYIVTLGVKAAGGSRGKGEIRDIGENNGRSHARVGIGMLRGISLLSPN